MISPYMVWAHNSHLGDARYTSMSWSNGELNVGQPCREAFRKSAGLLACGTHTAAVAAAHNWDDEMTYYVRHSPPPVR